LKKTGFGAGKWGGFGGKIEGAETATQAAVRELREESSLKVAPDDWRLVGCLDFCFPARTEWSQVVQVFTAGRWQGRPVESSEMRPAWFAIDQIPYDKMWQDCMHWLPRVLEGERIEACFVFATDNETVERVEIRPWHGRRRAQ
jgi:8-oxo-dGTP pyrophosphatase MutT (NUDIX family)